MQELKEVAFFGKVTAGVTHEIRNVLAIIKESCGLMEDILCLVRNERPEPRERLESALSRIQAQVDRGVAIATHLNKFAHSTDQSVAEVDLVEMIEQVVFLAQRFARLSEVKLEAKPHKSPLTIFTAPVRLQMAVFLSVELLFNLLPSGGEIALSASKVDQMYEVGVQWKAQSLGVQDPQEVIMSSENWGELQNAMNSLRGKAGVEKSSNKILLYFPKSIS